MSHSVVVLGSELDGMVAALALAKRGTQVTLIEESETVGGLSAAVEIAPGYRASPMLDRGRLRGDLLRRLEIPATALAPAPDWRRPTAEGDLTLPIQTSGGPAWSAEIASLTGWAQRIVQRPSPPLDPRDDWRAALTAGWSTRLLGAKKLRKVMRAGSLSVADWITEFIADGPDAACLARPALESTVTGPSAAGTGFNTLLRAGAAGSRAAQGLPQLMRQLEQQAQDRGVAIEFGTPIQAIHRESSGLSVELASGKSYAAQAVVSALAPQRTLLDLCEQTALAVTFNDSLRVYRSRGAVGVVMIALDHQPPPLLASSGTIYQVNWDSLAHLEKAADGFKVGSTVERPPLEISFPEVNHPSQGESGVVALVHVATCAASTPRQRLERIALEGVETLWNGASQQVAAITALNPDALAQQFSLPGGHLEHGEWALDQLLFLRPDLHCRGTATPIPGLFLCGPGVHPGVGLNGTSGWSAAQQAQKHRP